MSKTVRFLIGPPQIGKTTARNTHPDLVGLPYADVFEAQLEINPDHNPTSEDDIWKSYYMTRDRLLELLEEHDDVVLEHTLLRACRRPMYIDAVRDAYPDAEIICYYVYPDLDEYFERRSLIGEDDVRGADEQSEALARKIGSAIAAAEKNHIRGAYDMFEIPTEAEGFDKVIRLS